MIFLFLLNITDIFNQIVSSCIVHVFCMKKISKRLTEWVHIYMTDHIIILIFSDTEIKKSTITAEIFQNFSLWFHDTRNILVRSVGFALNHRSRTLAYDRQKNRPASVWIASLDTLRTLANSLSHFRANNFKIKQTGIKSPQRILAGHRNNETHVWQILTGEGSNLGDKKYNRQIQ